MRELKKSAVQRALLLLLTLLSTLPAHAQYYSWGADPASLKWRTIKTDKVRLIYPDTVDVVARRTLHYINAVSPDISYGYKYPAMRVPFILHPENSSSNGMVMWLPKRVEFLTSPAVDGFSMPWIKQLVAHEYRHAVQYNNLNRGVVKVASYLLGEQGSTIGLLFLPLWVLEGDAVMCETQMSSFGRGVQPSFSMGYRAIGRDMLKRKNLDRWFCGSYLNYTPDHYELGYQTISYAYTHYNENVWDKVASFGVHRPYYIATVSTALKKYYGTNSAKLTRAAFTDLFDYWDSLPQRDNTAEIVAPIDTTNYTTYSHPIPYNNESVVTLKEDYLQPRRFVMHDRSGKEERIAFVGSVSTRPTLGEDRLWWSEYRRSTLFAQRVNSQLCYMDVLSEKPRIVRGIRNALYPTTIDNSENHIAYVEYRADGQYSLVEIKAKGSKTKSYKDFELISRTAIQFPTEVHGLAWDNLTQELYFIATDDSGMWLGARDTSRKEGFRQLQKGAYITLSDLRAKDGKLYFGSIESGYDEMHCFDIVNGKESRISQSTYGSFDPSTPSSDGYIYGTTYDRHGYHLSKVESGAELGEVERKRLPENIVNPKRIKLDVINLDSVSFTPTDSIVSHKRHKSKKYNKAANLINLHSWIPFAYNPFEYVEENRTTVAAGATLLSQNLLSSADGYASYGYNSLEGSMFSAGLKYDGLGVALEAGVSYGGNQVVYDPFGFGTTRQQEYYSVSAKASLPMVLSNGYLTQVLTPSALWSYSNGLVFDLDSFDIESYRMDKTAKIGFDRGLHKLTLGLTYSGSTRSAMRNLQSPLAYILSANYALSPMEDSFSDLLMLYGALYGRGFKPTHAATLKLCYQNSFGGYTYNGINLLSFQSAMLLPAGYSTSSIVNNHYNAASLDYQFPICYPEGGIGSILYIRRIRMDVGVDGGTFRNYSNQREYIYSYGVGLLFDINTMRLPESATTTIEFSLYQTKSGDVGYQFGAVLPF